MVGVRGESRDWGLGRCPKRQVPLTTTEHLGKEGRAWGGAGNQSHHWMSEIRKRKGSDQS